MKTEKGALYFITKRALMTREINHRLDGKKEDGKGMVAIRG